MKSNCLKLRYLYISIIFFAILLTYSISYSEGFTENEIKYFQDITYCINLRKRPERLKHFLEMYNTSDLAGPYRTIEAVDGSTLDLEKEDLSEDAIEEIVELGKLGYRTKHYQLTMGAIGCYHSHVDTWTAFAYEQPDDVGVALIFEDDARIPPDLQSTINTSMMYAPSDWDIILLGVACHSCETTGNTGLFQKVNHFWLMHAYLINKKGAQKILDSGNLFPITQQIDSLLSQISGKINIYALTNNPVKQMNFSTDIQAPIQKVDGVFPMMLKGGSGI